MAENKLIADLLKRIIKLEAEVKKLKKVKPVINRYITYSNHNKMPN